MSGAIILCHEKGPFVVLGSFWSGAMCQIVGSRHYTIPVDLLVMKCDSVVYHKSSLAKKKKQL